MGVQVGGQVSGAAPAGVRVGYAPPSLAYTAGPAVQAGPTAGQVPFTVHGANMGVAGQLRPLSCRFEPDSDRSPGGMHHQAGPTTVVPEPDEDVKGTAPDRLN